MRIMSPLFTVAMVIAAALADYGEGKGGRRPQQEGDVCACFLRWSPMQGKCCLLGQMIASIVPSVNDENEHPLD